MNLIQCFYRHPGFEISRGEGKPQFVVHDIAVLKVDDTLSQMLSLRPACLPTSDPLPAKAVHAGWSSPPPLRETLMLKLSYNTKNEAKILLMENYKLPNIMKDIKFFCSLLEAESNGYVEHYRDFFKLWHLKINISSCKDPEAPDEKFPSDSYYPFGKYNY